MARKRRQRKSVFDPKLVPSNLTPPPPPDLKLQVRGTPDSGYRVCTYLSCWRPAPKGADGKAQRRGSSISTHVETVGYIEKHKRSGKIIFMPAFYSEVSALRYYDVYRDFDHCTYQLRADWREVWYLTERGLYEPPEESRNLKKELSRLRKLVMAKKRAALKGIDLEIDLEAPPPPDPEELERERLEREREERRARWHSQHTYNPYMVGHIPTTDALAKGVYRAEEQDNGLVGTTLTAQLALAVGEQSVAPNIVPAIAKAGKRAPKAAQAPGPEAYLSLSDDPNSEWHAALKVKPVAPPPPAPFNSAEREFARPERPVPPQGERTQFRANALQASLLRAGSMSLTGLNISNPDQEELGDNPLMTPDVAKIAARFKAKAQAKEDKAQAVKDADKPTAKPAAKPTPKAKSPKLQPNPEVKPEVTPQLKSSTKYRPNSALQGTSVLNVGSLRLKGAIITNPDAEEEQE